MFTDCPVAFGVSGSSDTGSYQLAPTSYQECGRTEPKDPKKSRSSNFKLERSYGRLDNSEEYEAEDGD